MIDPRVQELRDKHEIGLETAKKIVKGEDLRLRIERVSHTFGLLDLKAVLREIVDDLYPKEPE